MLISGSQTDLHLPQQPGEGLSPHSATRGHLDTKSSLPISSEYAKRLPRQPPHTRGIRIQFCHSDPCRLSGFSINKPQNVRIHSQRWISHSWEGQRGFSHHLTFPAWTGAFQATSSAGSAACWPSRHLFLCGSHALV